MFVRRLPNGRSILACMTKTIPAMTVDPVNWSDHPEEVDGKKVITSIRRNCGPGKCPIDLQRAYTVETNLIKPVN
jgi:hypothetical protein